MLPCSQSVAHDHPGHDKAERAAGVVFWLTVVTMTGEIAGGWWTGSMALLAEGWHMGLHAAAMGVAVFAYRFIRRHRTSGRYSFGAGKAGELAGFTNAVMLAVVSVLIGAESVARLVTPEAIAFGPALVVAGIGLAVNLLSALVLRDDPCAAHGCAHGGAHHHHDSNRRAAFVHVLSDALTSALAIVALLCGRCLGWTWMDPAMVVVGAVVILRWSLHLVRQSGDILLDAVPDAALAERIVTIAREHGDEGPRPSSLANGTRPDRGHRQCRCGRTARLPRPTGGTARDRASDAGPLGRPERRLLLRACRPPPSLTKKRLPHDRY